MFKNKVAFLVSGLFSSQSDLFESFLNRSDRLEKNRPSKNATTNICGSILFFFDSAYLMSYSSLLFARVLQFVLRTK